MCQKEEEEEEEEEEENQMESGSEDFAICWPVGVNTHPRY